MKTLSLILVLAVVCMAGCRESNETKRELQPAYPLGSTEFNSATPEKFQTLKVGMEEKGVLAAVGEPLSKKNFMPLGQFPSEPVGVRYTYSLEGEAGVVWIDFDTNKQVTGIFWRDRD
jgi:hypothetical protein